MQRLAHVLPLAEGTHLVLRQGIFPPLMRLERSFQIVHIMFDGVLDVLAPHPGMEVVLLFPCRN